MQQKQKFNRLSHIRTQPQQNQLSLQKSIQNYNRSRLKSLFYIRSKNTQKYYKNHPYFQSIVYEKKQNQSGNKKYGNGIVTTQYETKQPEERKSIINQKRFKTQKDQFQSKDKYYNSTNQFVSYPTNYGLENTVKYIQEQSFLNKKTVFNKNKLLLTKNNQNSFQLKKIKRRYSLTYQITSSNEKDDKRNIKNNYMKNTAAYQSKFYDRAAKSKKTYYNEGNDQKRISIQQKIKNNNTDSKKINESLSKSQSLNQSIGHNRNIIYNAPSSKLQKKPSLAIRQTPSLQNGSASHPITIIYGKRIKSFQQIPQRQITFDILPYLINTFLKCKIRYKQMTLKQYNIIKTYIIKTIQTKIKYVRYDIKDIINLSTVKLVIDFLEQFKNQEKDYEWVETMRYFFITKEEKVLQYQINKIKDQVAKLISIKYDAQFGKKQLFIYNVETKTLVESFYDFIKGHKFIIGDQEDVFEQYQSIINQKLEQQSFQQKINRWKGITDTQKQNQNKSQKFSPTKSVQKGNLGQGKLQQSRSKFVTTKRLSQQKFNSLFQKFKIRQKKKLRKSFSTNSNLILSKQSSVSFIDRSKLKKQTDIFQ